METTKNIKILKEAKNLIRNPKEKANINSMIYKLQNIAGYEIKESIINSYKELIKLY